MTRFFTLLVWFALIHGAAIAADAPVAAPDAQLQRTVEDHLLLPSFKADPILVSTITYYGPLAVAMRKALEGLSASQLQLKMAAPYLAEYPGISVKSPPRIEAATPQNTLRISQEFVFGQFWEVTKLDQVRHKMVMWSLTQKILPLSGPNWLALTEEPNLAARIQSGWPGIIVKDKSPIEVAFPGIYRHDIIADAVPEMLILPQEGDFKKGQANFVVTASTKATAKSTTWRADLQLLPGFVYDITLPTSRQQFINTYPCVAFDVNAHVLSKNQLAGLADAVKAVAPGKWKQSPLHDRAKLAILHFNVMLESDQLSQYLRSHLLQARAVSLMTLGVYNPAALDLNNALAANLKDEPDLFYWVALNAFAKQQDAVAKEYTDNALVLAPDGRDIRILKLMLDYLSGDYKNVAKTAQTHFTPPRDDDAFALWHYLARRQSGEDGKAELQAHMAKLISSEWVYKMGQYFLEDGKLSAVGDSFVKVTKDHKFQTTTVSLQPASMVLFFAAEKMMLDGNKRRAKEYWEGTVELGLAHSVVYMAAKRRLAALNAAK